MLTEISSAWNPLPRRQSPLIVFTAPPTIGTSATYSFIGLAEPAEYHLHWPSRGRKSVPLPGNAGRARCAGPNCGLCAAGFTRQTFRPVLVIDLDRRCVAVASMSDAVWRALAVAVSVADTEQLDAAPAVQFVIHAARERGGPRYWAELKPIKLGPGLSLSAYLGTEDGKRWWDTISARTSEKLLNADASPNTAADPLSIIFPAGT